MIQNQTIIIKRSPTNWEAFIYTFDHDYDVGKGLDTITNIKCKKITPESGWDNFTKTIFSLDITSLPDMSQIPTYPGSGADGDTYCVEIVTESKYRFYKYYEPIANNKINEAQKMLNIIKLFNKEFNLSWPINNSN